MCRCPGQESSLSWVRKLTPALGPFAAAIASENLEHDIPEPTRCASHPLPMPESAMNVRISFLARLRVHFLTLARLRDRASRTLRIIATRIHGPAPASPIPPLLAEVSSTPAPAELTVPSLPFSFTSPSGGIQPVEMVVHRFCVTAGAIPTTRTTTQGNASLPHQGRLNEED